MTDSPTPPAPCLPSGKGTRPGPRLLITAGPTHEPIDAVRYIGNRSSGRLGIALADAAARRERMGNGQAAWGRVTLLLGPTAVVPSDPRVCVHRFRSTADLGALLAEHAPGCDVLVMAAAVADYTVSVPPGSGEHPTKMRREKEPVTLTLVPTPDLLAGAAAKKRADQFFVGFALEPEERLIESAKEKLIRKGVDLIVANPLETMDAATIRATLVYANNASHSSPLPIPLVGDEGRREMSKEAFAELLLDVLERRAITGGQ